MMLRLRGPGGRMDGESRAAAAPPTGRGGVTEWKETTSKSKRTKEIHLLTSILAAYLHKSPGARSRTSASTMRPLTGPGLDVDGGVGGVGEQLVGTGEWEGSQPVEGVVVDWARRCYSRRIFSSAMAIQLRVF